MFRIEARGEKTQGLSQTCHQSLLPLQRRKGKGGVVILKKKKKIHTKIDQFAIQFLSQRLHLPFPWRQRVRSGRAGLGPPPQPIFQMRCTKAPGRLGLVQRVQKGEGTKHGSRLQWAPPCLCPACLPTGSGPGHCRAD